MAEITKVALKVDNNNSFPNNNAGAITPAILRAFNVNMIDSMVDEIGYTADSASWNVSISNINAFTASAQSLTTSSLLITASAQPNSNVITFTKGNGSTFNVTVATGSIPDISNLNQATASLQAFTASAQISINNLNTTTASLNSSVTQLNANTASQQVSINALNQSSASQQVSIDSINSKTGSFATTGSNIFVSANTFTSISASSFVSASQFVGDGSKITGITSSISLPILDEGIPVGNAVSMNFTGSAISAIVVGGTAVISVDAISTSSFNSLTASFNAYTASTNSDLNAIHQATASLQTNSASVNISITNLNASSASQQVSIDALNTNSASVNTSISALNTFTASQSTASLVTSITNLNTFSASALVSISNINSTTASLLVETQNLELFSASALISISNLNASSASQQISIDNLNTNSASVNTSITNINSATASLNTSASLALVTASFDTGTRNLTFTKGNTTQFSVNIPDVSGSAGTFVTTSSFNAYTQSNDQRVSSLEVNSASVNTSITNINTTTASLNTSVSALNTFTASQSTASLVTSINNLNTFSASALVSISNLNTTTQSLNTSVTNLNSATASLFGSASLSLYTASAVGNTITFTKGDTSTFSVSIVPAPIDTGSFATTASFNAYTSSTNSRLNNIETTTASLNTSVSNLNTATASLFTSTSLSLITASFDNGTRNLTFTKGDNQTFSVNIPDVSGSTSGFATLGANTFTGSQTISSSLFISGNINMVNGSDLVTHHVKAAGSNGLELQTSAGTNIVAMGAGGGTQAVFVGAVSANSISASTINGLGDPLAFSTSVDSRLDSLEGITGSFTTTASFNSYTASNDQKVNSLIAATGSYATTGSNSFNGNQTITGSLILSSSNAVELQVMGNSVFTGSAFGNVVSMSITSNTASMDLNTGNYFTLSIPTGTTRISPSNIQAGTTATLVITTASGSLVTFDSSVKQPSGSAYVPTSGSIDILSFVSVNSSSLFAVSTLNMI